MFACFRKERLSKSLLPCQKLVVGYRPVLLEAKGRVYTRAEGGFGRSSVWSAAFLSGGEGLIHC